MSTRDELLHTLNQQTLLIRESLLAGYYDIAVSASKLLTTSLQVKIKELGEGEVKYDEKGSGENGN